MREAGMHRDHELHRRRRGRNIGVLVALVLFAALSFWVTISKLAANAPAAGG